MALNKVILYGRLTKDIELRKTSSGTAVVKFTVACDRPFANKQSGERECDFIECTAWRGTAEFLSRYFKKGDSITVDGSLRNNNYEDKNGVKHYSFVVMADNIGFGAGKKESQSSAPVAAESSPLSGLNLDDFEEILSDQDDAPF